MQKIFKLDGKYYDVAIRKLTRSATVLDNDKTGRTLDGAMHRFIIGTYYNYTLELDIRNAADYDAFYEAITAPVPSHDLVVPYGQSTLSFRAYVTDAEDELLIQHKNKNYWNGLAINFVAMKPQRYPA